MEYDNAEAIVALYQQAKTLRYPCEEDWRKAAAYVLPAHYQSWTTEGRADTGQTGLEAARRVNYDSTGMLSLPKYTAILERLATPSGQQFVQVRAKSKELRRVKRVQAFYDNLTDTLRDMRMHPAARFRTTASEVYQGMGVYGNGPLYIGKRSRITGERGGDGIKYVACQLKNCFVLVDDEGNIVGFFRRIWLNLRQFKSKFPDVSPPRAFSTGAKGPTENKFEEFVHYVCMRDAKEYDPTALDRRRHPWVGQYVCVKDKAMIGEQSGYTSMPYKMPRTATMPDNAYGYSPAMLALASLGGASAMKKANLKIGNRAADPTILTPDDVTFNGNVDIRPGRVNPGGVNADGRRLFQILESGDFRVAEALLQDERMDTRDAFFVTLFDILSQTPEMTATEVMERVAERIALLSPTLARLQSEFLGPMVDREVDMAFELGMINEDDIPPEVLEDGGEFETIYTSPMAKNIYAEDISGFMRSFEMASRAAEVQQDPSPLDHFNMDTAIPEISEHLSVPARWLRSPDEIAQMREQRSEQAQQDQLVNNAAGLGAAANALGNAGGGQP